METPIDEKINTPIDEKIKDNITSINITSINKKQQPEKLKTKTEKDVVVVSEPAKNSKWTKTALDVSCLSFIAELSDRDKISILKKTGNDIEGIQAVYEMPRPQGGIESLTAYIISMVKKRQNGEITQPVSIKPPVKQNRFNNFTGRGNYDYDDLERQERELLFGGEE